MVNILYFSAVWCAPCQAFHPQVAKLAEEFKDSVQISYMDVDRDVDQKASYLDVRSVPTLVFLKDNKEIKRIVGGVSYTKLVEALKEAEQT